MDNRKKTVIAVFAVMCVIGFCIGKLCKSTPPPPPPPIIEHDDSANSNVIQNVSIYLEASNPELKGSEYSVTVSCINAPKNVRIIYEAWNLRKSSRVSTSETGKFTNLPGIAGGEYRFIALNAKNDTIMAKKEVQGFDIVENKEPKMTKQTFQRLLVNQSDITLLGGNKKVAAKIKFSFRGLVDGERVPDDVQSIREKLSNETWSSLRVLSVGYGQDNKINSAVIQPIYN